MKKIFIVIFSFYTGLLFADCFDELVEILERPYESDFGTIRVVDLHKLSSGEKYIKKDSKLSRFESQIIAKPLYNRISFVKFDKYKVNNDIDFFSSFMPKMSRAKRESFNSYFDKYLGFNIVAPTYHGNWNGMDFSMQRFSDGFVPGINKMQGPLDDDSIQKVALFDILTGQLDRGNSNFAILPDGRIELIDNGESFPIKHPFGHSYYMFWKSRAASKSSLSKEIIQKILEIDPDEISSIATMHFGIEYEAVNLFTQRVKYVQDLLKTEKENITPNMIFNKVYYEMIKPNSSHFGSTEFNNLGGAFNAISKSKNIENNKFEF